MARGRMIDNCISISEKINDLTIKEAFVYTWIIPHLDDWGRISGSPRKLKAIVFPMKKEISIGDLEEVLNKFKNLGLFLWEVVEDISVLQQPFKEFSSHQAISDSKRAKSKYPEIDEDNITSPRIPKNPLGSPAQVKLSKEKLREGKGRETLYHDIINIYNKNCSTLPQVEVLSDKRKDSIRIRFKEYGMEKMETLFVKAGSSKFLKGENKNGWKATFDWLLNETNMIKVLEGNFDDKPEENWKL